MAKQKSAFSDIAATLPSATGPIAPEPSIAPTPAPPPLALQPVGQALQENLVQPTTGLGGRELATSMAQARQDRITRLTGFMGTVQIGTTEEFLQFHSDPARVADTLRKTHGVIRPGATGEQVLDIGDQDQALAEYNEALQLASKTNAEANQSLLQQVPVVGDIATGAVTGGTRIVQFLAQKPPEALAKTVALLTEAGADLVGVDTTAQTDAVFDFFADVDTEVDAFTGELTSRAAGDESIDPNAVDAQIGELLRGAGELVPDIVGFYATGAGTASLIRTIGRKQATSQIRNRVAAALRRRGVTGKKLTEVLNQRMGKIEAHIDEVLRAARKGPGELGGQFIKTADAITPALVSVIGSASHTAQPESIEDIPTALLDMAIVGVTSQAFGFRGLEAGLPAAARARTPQAASRRALVEAQQRGAVPEAIAGVVQGATGEAAQELLEGELQAVGRQALGREAPERTGRERLQEVILGAAGGAVGEVTAATRDVVEARLQAGQIREALEARRPVAARVREAQRAGEVPVAEVPEARPISFTAREGATEEELAQSERDIVDITSTLAAVTRTPEVQEALGQADRVELSTDLAEQVSRVLTTRGGPEIPAQLVEEVLTNLDTRAEAAEVEGAAALLADPERSVEALTGAVTDAVVALSAVTEEAPIRERETPAPTTAEQAPVPIDTGVEQAPETAVGTAPAVSPAELEQAPAPAEVEPEPTIEPEAVRQALSQAVQELAEEGALETARPEDVERVILERAGVTEAEARSVKEAAAVNLQRTQRRQASVKVAGPTAKGVQLTNVAEVPAHANAQVQVGATEQTVPLLFIGQNDTGQFAVVEFRRSQDPQVKKDEAFEFPEGVVPSVRPAGARTDGFVEGQNVFNEFDDAVAAAAEISASRRTRPGVNTTTVQFTPDDNSAVAISWRVFQDPSIKPADKVAAFTEARAELEADRWRVALPQSVDTTRDLARRITAAAVMVAEVEAIRTQQLETRAQQTQELLQDPEATVDDQAELQEALTKAEAELRSLKVVKSQMQARSVELITRAREQQRRETAKSTAFDSQRDANIESLTTDWIAAAQAGKAEADAIATKLAEVTGEEAEARYQLEEAYDGTPVDSHTTTAQVAELAAGMQSRFGVTVVFMHPSDPDFGRAFGRYDLANGTIFLRPDMPTERTVRTLAHELTHHIIATSGVEWTQLRDAIVKTAGLNAAQLRSISDKRTRAYGRKLSEEEAVAEAVAVHAAQDPKFVAWMAGRSPNISERVRSALKRLSKFVKSLFGSDQLAAAVDRLAGASTLAVETLADKGSMDAVAKSLRAKTDETNQNSAIDHATGRRTAARKLSTAKNQKQWGEALAAYLASVPDATEFGPVNYLTGTAEQIEVAGERLNASRVSTDPGMLKHANQMAAYIAEGFKAITRRSPHLRLKLRQDNLIKNRGEELRHSASLAHNTAIQYINMVVDTIRNGRKNEDPSVQRDMALFERILVTSAIIEEMTDNGFADAQEHQLILDEDGQPMLGQAALRRANDILAASIAEAGPHVLQATKLRRTLLQDNIQGPAIQLGLLDKSQARKNYFPQLNLHHLNNDRMRTIINTDPSKRRRDPGRAFSTDYIETEHASMAAELTRIHATMALSKLSHDVDFSPEISRRADSFNKREAERRLAEVISAGVKQSDPNILARTLDRFVSEFVPQDGNPIPRAAEPIVDKYEALVADIREAVANNTTTALFQFDDFVPFLGDILGAEHNDTLADAMREAFLGADYMDATNPVSLLGARSTQLNLDELMDPDGKPADLGFLQVSGPTIMVEDGAIPGVRAGDPEAELEQAMTGSADTRQAQVIIMPRRYVLHMEQVIKDLRSQTNPAKTKFGRSLRRFDRFSAQMRLRNPTRIANYLVTNAVSNMSAAMTSFPELAADLGSMRQGFSLARRAAAHSSDLTAEERVQLQEAWRYGVLSTSAIEAMSPGVQSDLRRLQNLMANNPTANISRQIFDWYNTATRSAAKVADDAFKMMLFLHLKKKAEAGKVDLFSRGGRFFGGARASEVRAAENNVEAAAIIAKQTLGDHTDVSPFANFLGAHMAIFYRWNEVSLRRMFRQVANTVSGQDWRGRPITAAARAVQDVTIVTGMLFGFQGVLRTYNSVRMVALFNGMGSREREEIEDAMIKADFDPWTSMLSGMRRNPDTDQLELITIPFPTAFQDVANRLGFARPVETFQRLMGDAGNRPIGEQLANIMASPAKNIFNLLNPSIDLGISVVTSAVTQNPGLYNTRYLQDGRPTKLFEESTNTTRDLANMFGLAILDDTLAGETDRRVRGGHDFASRLFGGFVQTAEANNFYHARELVGQGMRNLGIREDSNNIFDLNTAKEGHLRRAMSAALRGDEDSITQEMLPVVSMLPDKLSRKSDEDAGTQILGRISNGWSALGLSDEDVRKSVREDMSAEDWSRVISAVQHYDQVFAPRFRTAALRIAQEVVDTNPRISAEIASALSTQWQNEGKRAVGNGWRGPKLLREESLAHGQALMSAMGGTYAASALEGASSNLRGVTRKLRHLLSEADETDVLDDADRLIDEAVSELPDLAEAHGRLRAVVENQPSKTLQEIQREQAQIDAR